MKGKSLLIIFWIFLIGSILVFLMGLRYEELKVELTVIALGLFGISFLINKWIKNENQKKGQ